MEYHWYEDYKDISSSSAITRRNGQNDSGWRISTRISRCFCLHGCWIMDIVYFFISRVELSPS